jgi:hypothetical protein
VRNHEKPRSSARAWRGRIRLVERDVDSDPALAERWGRSIPVLEIGGALAFKVKLSASEFERKFARMAEEWSRARELGGALYRIEGGALVAQLFVLSGPDAGKSVRAARRRQGRTLARVRRHAQARLDQPPARALRVRGGEWFVVDDGSRNGVLVDKKRVPRARLADMQEFQLGSCSMRFRASGASSAMPSSASSAACIGRAAGAKSRPPRPAKISCSRTSSARGRRRAALDDEPAAPAPPRTAPFLAADPSRRALRPT